MTPTDSTQAPVEMKQVIERQIQQRSWGRIHRLEVEVIDERVIVHGYTHSYYSKQLALEGVLDVIGSAEPDRVELDIQVAPSPAGTMNGHASRVEASWQ